MLQTCPAPIGPIIDAFTGGSSKRSDITSNLDKCINDGRAATEKVHFIGETSMVLEGVPASCMAEAKAWNEHPHAAILAKDYGTVKVLNSTAIRFDGLPQKTVDIVQGAMTKSN
ncbi:MAG: hypothetical protein HETSPECPRED_009732 [Heterodermia speciosa]|uniref:Uncharacterized protein n=1 Tax=Heterodermia speciosa TaxID=116794 RepID=A0A8H3G654_9LECA|nr:MAG: hypothetical protein HETSPECPRED_009732 [Heterodermia speciosa]